MEDLILRLQAVGFRETAAEVDASSESVSNYSKKTKEADKSTTSLKGSVGGLKDMIKSSAGMFGAGALAFGLGDAVKSAQQLQEAQAQLGRSITANVHRPAAGATQQMTDFAESMSQKGGFMPTDSLEAMSQFLRMTHSVGEAEKDLSLSTNIARGAHVSLTRAERALMQVEAGHVTGLNRLGLNVQTVTTAQNTLTATVTKASAAQKLNAKNIDIAATRVAGLKAITQDYGGALATFSDTSSGHLTVLKNNVEILGEKVGGALLPVLGLAAKALGSMIGPLTSIVALIKPLAPGIMAAVAAWGAYRAITAVVAVTQAVLTSTFVTEEAALVSMIFSVNSLGDAMAALTLAIDAVPFVGWVAIIGTVIVAVVTLAVHCKTFRDVLLSVWHAIKVGVTDAVNWVIKEFLRMQHFIESLPHKIGHLISKIPVLGSVIHVGGGIVHGIGSILGLAAGGPVPSTSSVLVGERGPEIVTLPGGSYVHPNSSLRNVGDDRPIVIYNILDGKVLSQAIIRQGLLQRSRGG